jgi:hypothetical protein
VVVMMMTGQFGALTRLLTTTGHRGRTAVMAVMMRLMLMGRMGEHGGRRVLMTVMMMVMVMGSGDHSVTVNVLLTAAATTNVIALMMRRRMTTDNRGAAGVETQEFLNGERRSLRQRRSRDARNAAGCGQQAAQQSWRGHVNVTIGMLK